MDTDLITIIIGVIAAIGGIPGITFISDWWTNKDKGIRFASSSAEYSVTTKLDVSAKIQLINEKKTQSSITDILGFIQTAEGTRNTDSVLHSRPVIKGASLPIQLEGESSVMLNLIFLFNHTDLSKTSRMLTPMWTGHLENGIPVIIADERDFIEKKESLPLHFNVIISIDGKQNIEKDIPAFSRGKGDLRKGSIADLDILQIKRKFVNKGRVIAIN